MKPGAFADLRRIIALALIHLALVCPDDMWGMSLSEGVAAGLKAAMEFERRKDR